MEVERTIDIPLIRLLRTWVVLVSGSFSQLSAAPTVCPLPSAVIGRLWVDIYSFRTSDKEYSSFVYLLTVPPL